MHLNISVHLRIIEPETFKDKAQSPFVLIESNAVIVSCHPYFLEGVHTFVDAGFR